jgi:hypothetical protein
LARPKPQGRAPEEEDELICQVEVTAIFKPWVATSSARDRVFRV